MFALQHLQLTVIAACSLDVYIFKITSILKYIRTETFSPSKLLASLRLRSRYDR